MNDLISRQMAIKELNIVMKLASETIIIDENPVCVGVAAARMAIEKLPSARTEPLTDKEQRIFLAAMGREMKVCEEVDRNYVREPYEDSLVSVCKEIERKVKGALWT